MSGRDFDVNQQLKSDAEMVRRLNKQGISDISPGAIIEYTLWTFSVLSVAGMMVALPWVGQDNLIPGTVWLGYSLACILLFGGLALLIRWVRQTSDDLDRGMNRRFDSTRGR